MALRVLHVIPSVAVTDGGPSKAIVLMEKALSAAGVTVTTATTDHGLRSTGDYVAAQTGEEQHPNGAARIYVHKWFDSYKVAPGIVPYLWANVRLFDVVHIHALFSFTSLAAGLIARIRRVPYIIRPLGTLANYGMTERRPALKALSLRLIEGPMLRHAAAVHFTSLAEQEEARSLGLPLRSAVIPLGVEPGPARQKPAPELQNPAFDGRQIVLYLSRLDAKKNVEGLLRAFALLKTHRKDVVLQIAGAGPADYMASLKTLATTLGLMPDRDVVWLGHIDGGVKAAAFAAADLFVLPSFSENFGIAVVEALFAGLPCVLCDGVAIAGDVQQAGAGLSVAPEPRLIADAVEQLLSDDALRLGMRANARQLAAREYSTETMALRLVALYRSVRIERAGVRA